MIHRIRIQNFKSLRDVTVDLSPVTVFVGKSGTGKTNFVTAIQFLRDYLELDQTVSQRYPACKCATNPSGPIAFEIEFDVPGFAERFRYTISIGEGNVTAPPQTECLNYGQRTIFQQSRKERAGHQWEVEPGLVSPPPPGAPALGRLPGIEEAMVAYMAMTRGVGIYAFPYGVLRKKPDGRKEMPGLADDGANYVHVLREVTSNLQDTTTRKQIASALRQINPTVASVELDSLQNPTKAFVGHRFRDKVLSLELAEESEGFRRFYAHLLALHQRPPKQTLIFEEPENGIYPFVLSLLADEFKAAPGAGRGQVLLTTHSPALLDHFGVDQIRVVELDDLETRIGQLAEEQREAIVEELLHAGELLTVDPARMEAK